MAPLEAPRYCEHGYPTYCQISFPLTDIDRRKYEAAIQRVLVFLSAEQRPEITSYFPFQRLPPEIRNRIYHLHLVRAEVTELRKWDDSLESRAREAVNVMDLDSDYMPPLVVYTALSILAASRQLHHEALAIFYHYNTLHLENVAGLRDFLSSIGPERRGFVRDISFCYGGLGSPAAFKRLATCHNLTKLHIAVSWETLHRSIPHSLRNAYGIGHLLKIRGLQTVEFSLDAGLQDDQTEWFVETVRYALLQPRAPKKASKGKNIAAGEKHTVESEEASKAKKMKSVHDESQIADE